MEENKSINACYEEIKRREIKELRNAIRNAGCKVEFCDYNAPIIICNFNKYDPRTANVRITCVELRDEVDEDVLYIFGQEQGTCGCSTCFEEEKEINISDIVFGQIEIITSEIPDKMALLHETIAQLSADIYNKVYNHCESYTDTCNEIIRLAKKFEEELGWQGGSDPRDYILELEKFEQEYLSTIED